MPVETMKTILTLVAILATLALVSCGFLNPVQQATAIQAIDQMLANGSITAEQHAALLDAILSSGIGEFWQSVVTTVTGAALGYFGVQVKRRADHKAGGYGPNATAAKPA